MIRAAFAALSHHASAVHVRLRAPLEWRIAAYQREHLVDRRCAEKAPKHDHHRKRAWVRSLYSVDMDDTRLFSLVLDASRFSPERRLETLLAAGGVQAALVAT
jgi:cytidylate kinase